jgi:hypothetical protein
MALAFFTFVGLTAFLAIVRRLSLLLVYYSAECDCGDPDCGGACLRKDDK